MTVPQAFDSLIAKLIVTGADRAQALERSRRALAEFEIGGMPTVLPFHRAVVDDPAFTSEPFTVHTRWIETEFAGEPAAVRGRHGRAGRPAARSGSGSRSRSAASAWRWCSRPGSAAPPGRAPPRPRARPAAWRRARVAGRRQRPRAATRWSAPCRARS